MFYQIAKVFVNLYLRLFFRVKVQGKIPETGACILCPNHTSYYDPVVVAAFCDRPLTFMAKKELFSSPVFGKLIRSLGAFPVNRDTGGLSAVKTAMTILKQGKVTLIFPEGKRNKTGKKLTPKPGAVMIARRTGVPVIPVGIKSSYRLFSELKVTYGEPVSYAQYDGTRLDGEQLEQLSDQLMDRILTLAEAEL